MAQRVGAFQVKLYRNQLLVNASLLIQFTFGIPFRASVGHFRLELEHTFTAFEVNIVDVRIFGLYLLSRQGGEIAATALGAGRFDLIAFLSHFVSPSAS